ncbi:MAG TPA: sigma-70 family RNA polymerase sigma factor [Blastocatellia bacterium]|nr:sigma-70 family RNA polymerase sigma factor [Blastocatellia bacterium]
MSTALQIENAFTAHERFLWGLCYRMTGNAADADDLVQETFVRAMKSPPARTDEPWRPWLVRVAINLSRDLLRQRKRQAYDGEWLPAPIETEPPAFDPPDESGNPATRYDVIESVSYAFLLALEALTPTQRAVLLLRDVFDYSVSETATALAMSEANVKTTQHRARKAMESYDRARRPITNALQEQTRQALEKFLGFLFNHDVAGAEALLAENVRQVSDGGGEFHAARVPIVGREKVLLFHKRILQIAQDHSYQVRSQWRVLNALPAVIFEIPNIPEGFAPRLVMLCQLDADGRIAQLHSVLASRKLTSVPAIAK